MLLVDNKEENYTLVKNLLKKIPLKFYVTDWVDSYKDAQDAIEKGKYDIYLINFHFEQNSGVELLKQILAGKKEKPVIILTEKSEKSVDQEVMELGAADYLIKETLDPEALERSIRYSIKQYKFLERLKENEQMFRSLFERSIDSILVLSFDNKIINVNDSFCKMMNLSKGDIYYRDFQSFFADRYDYKKFTQQLKKEGTVREMEVDLKRDNGSKLHAVIKASVQKEEDNNRAQYQVLVHDITRRKKTKKKLLRAEKHVMTGRIARSIAHEVRNPLTNINLAVDHLLEELQGEEEKMIYMDIIQRNSNRINQLITDLLKSAKPSKLDLRPVSLHELIEDTIHLTRDRIKLKDIELETDFDKTINRVNLDSSKMRTALLNIMINAIEAMEGSQGRLFIQTRGKEENCEIIIEDNGLGIPKDEIDKLFDPFYTGKPKGSGLGLTTVQNVINSHKGSIDVESEEGKGTRFIITLKKED